MTNVRIEIRDKLLFSCTGHDYGGCVVQFHVHSCKYPYLRLSKVLRVTRVAIPVRPTYYGADAARNKLLHTRRMGIVKF